MSSLGDRRMELMGALIVSTIAAEFYIATKVFHFADWLGVVAGVFMAVMLIDRFAKIAIFLLPNRSCDRVSRPPKNGEFLILLFMPNQAGDALLGDLEERFHRNVKRQGPVRAHLLYWGNAAISLFPLAWAAAKRLSGLAALYELFHKANK